MAASSTISGWRVLAATTRPISEIRGDTKRLEEGCRKGRRPSGGRTANRLQAAGPKPGWIGQNGTGSPECAAAKRRVAENRAARTSRCFLPTFRCSPPTLQGDVCRLAWPSVPEGRAAAKGALPGPAQRCPVPGYQRPSYSEAKRTSPSLFMQLRDHIGDQTTPPGLV